MATLNPNPPGDNPDLPPFNPPPPPPPTAEELLKAAQTLVATLTEFCESSKAAAAATTTARDSALASQKVFGETLTAAQAKLTEINTVATQVVAAKTKITDDQAVIATKSDHIQKAQEHADTIRASLDRALTSATAQATASEAQKGKAEASANEAAKALTAIQTTKATVDSDATTIAAAKKTAQESATVSKSLADKAATVETQIKEYEKRLAGFEEQCVAQLTKIETLLRGATSAGLAHAFDERRQKFQKPQNRWQVVFVCSLAAIVVLALSGLLQVHLLEKVPTYDELVRLWLLRLPIAAALVWLALHSSREAALAKRLEEDYGYKSAIASCFEGFRKQMAEISKDVAANSPLAKLCGDTLTTIATPPGRIYDKHKLTVSPSGEIAEAAKAVATAATAVRP
jgi:chemotaxis protein histidine kinase CheA